MLILNAHHTFCCNNHFRTRCDVDARFKLNSLIFSYYTHFQKFTRSLSLSSQMYISKREPVRGYGNMKLLLYMRTHLNGAFIFYVLQQLQSFAAF